MATKIYKFKDIVEAQHFLNGGVVGGKADVVGGLVGKTLILEATTVTFVAAGAGVDGDQNALRFKDIKAQIEGAVATVKVSLIDGKIAIVKSTPAAITVAKTGTGTALLGFSTQNDTVSKLFAPPPSAVVPAWTWACVGPDNSHIIYTLE